MVVGRFLFFFKQKPAYEMRISDWSQTCALPIAAADRGPGCRHRPAGDAVHGLGVDPRRPAVPLHAARKRGLTARILPEAGGGDGWNRRKRQTMPPQVISCPQSPDCAVAPYGQWRPIPRSAASLHGTRL